MLFQHHLYTKRLQAAKESPAAPRGGAIQEEEVATPKERSQDAASPGPPPNAPSKAHKKHKKRTRAEDRDDDDDDAQRTPPQKLSR